jgi:hypothetical protein
MAMNRKPGLCSLWLVILTGSLFSACHRGAVQADAVSAHNANQQLQLTQVSQMQEAQRLIALARDFATSDSRRRDLAWKTLNSYPRSELIEKLVQVQEDNATDEPDRLAVAFVLCNLDFDYGANKQLIVATMRKEPHNQNPYSDWAAELIGRLIRRGDKTLLPVLFEVAEWSDGALSEEISGVYLDSWRSDPKGFLTELKAVPMTARRQVYFLLINDVLLTAEDSSKMKVFLRSASNDLSVGSIAQEMLAAIPEIEKQHKQNAK